MLGGRSRPARGASSAPNCPARQMEPGKPSLRSIAFGGPDRTAGSDRRRLLTVK